MQHIASINGWTKFVSMQNHYNLLYREDEREMIPLCKDMQVTLTPYSPLAGGRLTRNENTNTLRNQFDKTVNEKYDATIEIDQPIIERVTKLAKQKNVTNAQIAMNWLYNKENVVPIVGGTKIKHLDEAVKALDITLENSEIQSLEELYQPHPIVGAL